MEDTEPTRRGPGRPPLARAEVRSDVRSEAPRERKRKGNLAVDRFAIPLEEIPPGTSYEWKRKTVLNAGDPAYDVLMREQGWLPVDVKRHPDFMPPGWQGAIERDGMILMERPQQLTDEARQEEQANARMMVRSKEEQMGIAQSGQFDRRNGNSSLSKVSRSIEPMEIPE